MGLLVKDAALSQTKALPNGAAAVSADGFDLKTGVPGDFLARCELLLEAPALVVGDLANGETMIYSIETDDNAAFSSATVLAASFLTQTGAGGAGAAAASKRFVLPVDVERYVRVKATNSGAGDASDKSMTVSLLF